MIRPRRQEDGNSSEIRTSKQCFPLSPMRTGWLWEKSSTCLGLNNRSVRWSRASLAWILLQATYTRGKLQKVSDRSLSGGSVTAQWPVFQLHKAFATDGQMGLSRTTCTCTCIINKRHKYVGLHYCPLLLVVPSHCAHVCALCSAGRAYIKQSACCRSSPPLQPSTSRLCLLCQCKW